VDETDGLNARYMCGRVENFSLHNGARQIPAAERAQVLNTVFNPEKS